MESIHSSDSDEMPEWAEDIMADLAIIADGRMPSSLLQSKEVLEAEAQLNNSVFDRLTDPQSFTGIQKQKNAKINRSRNVKLALSPNSNSQTIRKITSMQAPDNPDSISFIDGKGKKKKHSSRKSKDKVSKNFESTKRTVFDRLLSPSNLTGTQRQRFHHIHDKKGRTLEKAIESQHVSLRERSRVAEYEYEYDETETETDEREIVQSEFLLPDSDLSEKRNEFQNSSKLNEYSRLDVFERLNKTTTQAYKEKVHTNIAQKMLDDILSDNEFNEQDVDGEEENTKSEPHFDRVEEYASQDVFERLQRTTTEAYAKKKNNPLEDVCPSSPMRSKPANSDPPGVNLSSHKKRSLSSETR